jgi:hypothetical protein
VHFKVKKNTKFSKARARTRGLPPPCWRWPLAREKELTKGRPRVCATLPQIFDAYCNKKSLAKDQLRFLQDGVRINGDTTPEEVRSAASRPSPLRGPTGVSAQRPVLGRGAARV